MNTGRLLSRVTSAEARTVSQFDANGAPVSQTSYTRDNLGNILAKTEGASVTAYTYDPLYRLKTADAPGTAWDEAYTYDKAGNRLSFTRNGSGIYYEHDPANRLLKTRTGSAIGPIQYQFAYDFEGNLLTKKNAANQNLLSLAWNAKNQPQSLVAGSNTNTFTYDARGYRVAKTDSLGNKTYLLEGEHLEAVYSGAQLQAKYLRGAVIDEVVSAYQYDSTGKWINTTYHHDNLQSVTGLSGHNGDVYNLTAYTPFGETMQEAGPVKNFLKYTGREQDQDSGLYQYRARYYDPSIGRFISEDPLGFEAGINFYAYVENNPINANDPSGLAGNYGAIIDPVALYQGIKAGINDISNRITNSLGRVHPEAPPVSYQTFIKNTQGKTLTQIQNEAGQPGVNSAISAAGPDSSYRYVRDPANPDYIIDMRHFTVVGPRGNAFGLGVEILQGIGGDPSSAFDIQDFYSNNLGSKFFDNNFNSSKPFAPQLEQFFQNRVPTPTGTSGQTSFLGGSNAFGGFVIYPNKSNTNMTQSVYAK